MALRVARGLFRLWLVFLVLWIGAVGVVLWWAWDWGDEGPELDYWLRAGVLAFAPPVLVLALGSALVWAFRGFR